MVIFELIMRLNSINSNRMLTCTVSIVNSPKTLFSILRIVKIEKNEFKVLDIIYMFRAGVALLLCGW